MKKIIYGILLFVVLFVIFGIKIVPSGHTGVIVKMGAVQDQVLSEGPHLTIPFITKIVKIDNRVIRTDVDGESASKDLQTVSSTVSINYSVDREKSAYIYKNVGKDFENIVLRPAVQETVKAVVANYTAEQLITERQTVSSNMKNTLENRVKPYGLSVQDVNIINFNFSTEFNAAIEAKQTAQQNALKAEQDLQRIKVEAQQEIEKAKAEAEANKLKNQEITDNTLKMKWIEKWDGKLPTVTSNSNSIMDLGNILQ
ncbi:MAG: prohibitin family protein [Clostridia bacterium]|nr:prohibitin family protein [Clostridia bacterium]